MNAEESLCPTDSQSINAGKGCNRPGAGVQPRELHRRLKTELSHSQPAAWMAATANTGHSAFNIGKDGLTFETGRSQPISCELGSKDRCHLGRAGAPDPNAAVRLLQTCPTLGPTSFGSCVHEAVVRGRRDPGHKRS